MGLRTEDFGSSWVPIELSCWAALRSFLRGGWKAPVLLVLLASGIVFLTQGIPIAGGWRDFRGSFFLDPDSFDRFCFLISLGMMGMTLLRIYRYFLIGRELGTLEVEYSVSKKRGLLGLTLQLLLELLLQVALILAVLLIVSGNFLAFLRFSCILTAQVFYGWALSVHLFSNLYRLQDLSHRLVGCGLAFLVLFFLLSLTISGEGVDLLYALFFPPFLSWGMEMTFVLEGEDFLLFLSPWSDILKQGTLVLFFFAGLATWMLRRKELSFDQKRVYEEKKSPKQGFSRQLLRGVMSWGDGYKSRLKDSFEGEFWYLALKRSSFHFALWVSLVFGAFASYLTDGNAIIVFFLFVIPYFIVSPFWVAGSWLCRQKRTGFLELWLLASKDQERKLHQYLLAVWLKVCLELALSFVVFFMIVETTRGTSLYFLARNSSLLSPGNAWWFFLFFLFLSLLVLGSILLGSWIGLRSSNLLTMSMKIACFCGFQYFCAQFLKIAGFWFFSGLAFPVIVMMENFDFSGGLSGLVALFFPLLVQNALFYLLLRNRWGTFYDERDSFGEARKSREGREDVDVDSTDVLESL